MNSCRIIGTLGILLTLMLPVGDAPVIAQVPRTAELQAPSLPDVLERATPAVVNIAVLSLSPTESNPLYNDPYFRRFFNLPDLPQQQPRLSAGSGVIAPDPGARLHAHVCGSQMIARSSWSPSSPETVWSASR